VFHSEQGKVTDAGNQQAIRPSHAALLQLPQVASATDTASGTVPIASYVPLIMFAVLFGLSMDYQVFLVSQIEHQRGHQPDDRRAIAAGLASRARG
jgi:uncharacterized membrane protein YdfJ with MMPL/SSD domain